MAAVDFPASFFTDPSRAQRTLHTIHEHFIASGSQFSVDDFSTALHGHLALSPDPDVAVTNLLRFCEAALSKASLFNDLVHYPVTLEVLLKLFGYSQYFADILVRDPELFRWLTASDVLLKPQPKAALGAEVQRIERMFVKPERRLDSLRRLYRREVLRIGARDILGNADLATVTSELSDLADVLIKATCRLTESALAEKYGSSPLTPYVVIGLGKLGGGELNYSSDIDIIFVYGEEGKLATAKALTYHEYFNRFVEKMVQNLSQASGEGHIYRVDTRLRPESGMGPLARSVQSYLLYYESRGEMWERQMLIKGRPVAGDLEFGEQFMRQLVRFIYPRTHFTHPAESIARIKARIETAVAGDDNVKLQAGGIRDIEFIVQALQLLNGGRSDSLRVQNTLRAIALLTAEKLLTPDENVVLTDAYVFFRTLEHRLQTVLNTQTHSLPSDDRNRSSMAKRMGLRSADELMDAIGAHRRAVRKIFDNVLKVERRRDNSIGVERLLDGPIGEAEVLKVLAALGFSDPTKGARILRSFVSGSSLADGSSVDSRSRCVLREIAGQLFTEIARTPSPDLTLANLNTIVVAHRFRDQFFGELKEPAFRKLILTVCSVSPRLSRGIANDKLLLELLATNIDVLAQPWNGKRSRDEKLVVFKEREELRAGVRHVLGLCSFHHYTMELTRLADEAVASVFEEECRKKKLLRPPMAVFAVGKYGTRELSLDADLDVLFVAEQKRGVVTDTLEKLSAAMIQKLSSVGEKGKLYDVDPRLRPEGRNAPLVVDKRAYAMYLKERASLWERQSLTRLRFVCGDETLGQGVTDLVLSYVYETPLPARWTEEIVAMRRKMETRSHTRSPDFNDVKLGAGGMVDIEFMAQMIQLKFASKLPSLRFSSTLGVLKTAPIEALSQEACDFLGESYERFRRVELFMRLVLEEHSTVVPVGERLELLAKVIGSTRGEEVLSSLSERMKSVRSQFLHIANTLSST